ncbi:zinc dependent phospholipase C family protein [Sphingobacterium griseoflavum]|uniref:S1/P1 Nuclease n=1 Tax=Sphingobacterium griseoflavum TaxID=1474952 RepID=A0ABQ3HW88_9SPHI|nr:zinc dependent phospholipase C family protein [Sphingobacterium griseoflavum]GHE33742.1 hypothetical protein GCM10017764_16210 [Sphingobacterium griseoflavum]
MYKITCFLSIPLILLLSSWGFFAHKLINRHAVHTLPTELAAFYKKNIHLVTEKAVDPDKRCYVDTLESPRHYIDIDDYDSGQIDSIPIHWSKAKEKYQERQLRAHGIIPWQIHLTYQKLVKAFREQSVQGIIRHSADLGHYLADAHVPLHTTRNYNGQYTGQIGIHAFWESRIPEMFASRYKLLVGKATYIKSPLDTAWLIVRESHERVAAVLAIERQLAQEFPKDQQRSYIHRNNMLMYTYSDAYTKAYHHRMQGMVERRMRASIRRIGCYWFSAWVDAGQPKLDSKRKIDAMQDTVEITNRKMLGRDEWH